MKKKTLIISLILIVCVLCAAVAISACTVVKDKFVIENNVLVGLTSYGRGLDYIEVPEEVTCIRYDAFEYSKMTSIYIPSSVTIIQPQAFADCKNLTRITIDEENAKYASDGNCIIDKATNRVIAGCKGSVIPDYATGIGDYAFYKCRELTSIEIPENVTEIASCAFAECNKLQSIDIPKSVTNIGMFAFYKCSALTAVDIPEGVREIGEYVFAECSNLTSIELPDGITSIGKYAFQKCSALTGIDIPDGVSVIGQYAFAYCDSLTDVILPSSISQIAEGTFYLCSGLASVYVPEGVTSIGTKAFDSCRSLTSIDMPLSVTQIEDKAFVDCSSLIIRYKGTTKPDGWGSSTYNGGLFGGDRIEVPVILDSSNNDVADDGYIYTLSDNCLFYALKDGVAILKGHGKIDGDIVIDSAVEYKGLTYQVKEIGCSAFYNCRIDSVIIPQGVTKIGNIAFFRCDIASVELPNSLEQIGTSAFALCYELTSVYIPASVEIIERFAFFSCKDIYCQAEQQPEGWDSDWFIDNDTTVEWGYNPN